MYGDIYQGSRTTVKEKRRSRKKTIGIINKEVNFIGHRSILNDEFSTNKTDFFGINYGKTSNRSLYTQTDESINN